MSIERVPNSELTYYLTSFDRDGNETPDDDSSTALLSDRIVQDLAAGDITDVIMLCHGWKGDVPSAKRQYGAWLAAAEQCQADLERLRGARPGFKPLLIGMHWPSLPFGNEDPDAVAQAFSASGQPDIDLQIDAAAASVADTPKARDALRELFTAAGGGQPLPQTLPADLTDAYQTLFAETGLKAEGPGGAPGNDIALFDPQTVYEQARALAQAEPRAFGAGGGFSGLLWPLRQLSFWRMKARAREVGEGGMSAMLARLMETAPNAGFHIMGHSFGCIVASAIVNGRALPRDVDTLYLVQGALSHWGYCSEIPDTDHVRGYFHDLIKDAKVAGPVLVTRSKHDAANGKAYPIGAGLAGDMAFAPGSLPKFGALGTWGMNGPGIEVTRIDMLEEHEDYPFDCGMVYNVDASNTINGTGTGGDAHNDIAKPRVAHAFWQAVLRGFSGCS
ncbi:MAG: hypothetical protein EOM91_16615 [Sphingobacteriia bacterium]|nr:hypothetical protein [Sphingobacteriia bacterium]